MLHVSNLLLRPWRLLAASCAAACLTFSATGCGERISPEQIEEISSSVADVMVAVQRGSDSTERYRIADSVARTHDFENWAELRDEIGVIATEPERLRSLLDTTQRRIEGLVR